MKSLVIPFIFLMLSPSLLFAQTTGSKKIIVDKKFIFTGLFLAGTNVLDVESTFVGLDRCAGRCKEHNSLMRPFVNSGRPLTYVVAGAVDSGLMLWSYKLKKDGIKLWFIPPLLVGAAHGLAGGLNLRFVF